MSHNETAGGAAAPQVRENPVTATSEPGSASAAAPAGASGQRQRSGEGERTASGGSAEGLARRSDEHQPPDLAGLRAAAASLGAAGAPQGGAEGSIELPAAVVEYDTQEHEFSAVTALHHAGAGDVRLFQEGVPGGRPEHGEGRGQGNPGRVALNQPSVYLVGSLPSSGDGLDLCEHLSPIHVGMENNRVRVLLWLDGYNNRRDLRVKHASMLIKDGEGGLDYLSFYRAAGQARVETRSYYEDHRILRGYPDYVIEIEGGGTYTPSWYSRPCWPAAPEPTERAPEGDVQSKEKLDIGSVYRYLRQFAWVPAEGGQRQGVFRSTERQQAVAQAHPMAEETKQESLLLRWLGDRGCSEFCGGQDSQVWLDGIGLITQALEAGGLHQVLKKENEGLKKNKFYYVFMLVFIGSLSTGLGFFMGNVPGVSASILGSDCEVDDDEDTKRDAFSARLTLAAFLVAFVSAAASVGVATPIYNAIKVCSGEREMVRHRNLAERLLQEVNTPSNKSVNLIYTKASLKHVVTMTSGQGVNP